jgi:hypothetical protein
MASKLTMAKAKQIRVLAKLKNKKTGKPLHSQRAIAAKFKVSRSAIYAVIHNESWC